VQQVLDQRSDRSGPGAVMARRLKATQDALGDARKRLPIAEAQPVPDATEIAGARVQIKELEARLATGDLLKDPEANADSPPR
jgi:hypothetical protein